ncbi:MAG: BlaI/MecI/CopY family transcriptional regulator [Candidatus Solibacter usitatus]|nr:BlaI/MecI/CopY family transcriptional regulator [Candidatus Solibacter usitatus]
MSSVTSKPEPAGLGDLERDVMQLVWRHGPINAEQTRELLNRRLKESTIRTVLRRLEEKGFVTHSLDNRTYVYRAAELRNRVAARGVKRILDWFCNGSMEELLVGLVDSKVLDRDELNRLAKKLSRRKGAKS